MYVVIQMTKPIILLVKLQLLIYIMLEALTRE